MKRIIILLFLWPVMALSNIASTDYASNAANISSGTIDSARLPVGTSENTIAAGNDKRFDSIPTSKPTVTTDNTRALIWVE